MLLPISQYTQKRNASSERVAVFAFGRFNPPTKGHEKLFQTTHEAAERLGGDAFIFPSHTHGKRGGKQNPLPFDVKAKFMNALMPWANFVNEPSVTSPWNAVQFLADHGYTVIYLVAGSDRTEEYETRWLSHAQTVVAKAGVVNAGQRDPDGDGISGMSGTKAQEAALTGDIGAFTRATGWEGPIAEGLMMDVARYLTGEN